MRLLFFWALTILCVWGCKSDQTNKDQRSLTCYIRVLEAERRIRAEASMTTVGQGGTVVKDTSIHAVEIPNGINYQGVPMTLIPNEGLTYFKDYPGEFKTDHQFTWQNAAGEGVTFPIKMNNIKNFTFGSKTLSVSKPATFTWEPSGLERGEAMVLMWENPEAHLTVPMELYIQGSNPKIEFPAAKLKELTPGTWTLYVVRKKLTKAQIGPVIAQAVTEFYSKTDTLTITP
jgi:hypothetical protein